MFQFRATKVTFEKDLKVLSKVAFYFGIVNFNYDRLSHALNCKKFNTLFSFLLISALTLWLGFYSIGIISMFIATSLLYQCTLGQKIAIDIMCIFLMYLPAFIYVSRYLICKHTALPTVLDMLRIFKEIKYTCVPSLYYDRSFQKYLYLKLLCVGILVGKKFLIFIGDDTTAVGLVHLYAQLVCSTLDVAYVYSQLFLVCVYRKMNEALKKHQHTMNRATLTKRVRRFSRISAEVHRIKALCDSLLMPFFGAAFAGFLFDMIYLRYSNLENILNLFLVHRLSRMLLNAYGAFYRTASRLVEELEVVESNELEFHMELMDLGSCVHRLTTSAYGVVSLNARFLWKFFVNVFVVKAILCLHQVTMTQLKKAFFEKLLL